MTAEAARLPDRRRESLLTPAFRRILAITFLAFGMEGMLRSLVPLLVLGRGGDAVMVGLVTTAYAIPSLIFRPVVGTLVDSGRHRRLYRVGTLSSAVIPLLLFLPGSLALLAVRFVAGTAWGFFSVSNHSFMAKIAPANRRAEASGIFMSMPAIGQLILPGLGVLLYTTTGEAAPILLGVVLGLAAAAVTLGIPEPPAIIRPGGDERRSLLDRFIEPSALAATAMLVTSYSAYSIFAVFAAVYAQHVGSPVAVLVLYFPIFGLAQAISQPVFGRFADAMGRQASISVGALMAAAGLLFTIAPLPGLPPMATFTLGAFVYALSQSLINPTISALVMERAPKHRLGSAMATYSIGYQFSTGTASLLWGAIIASVGFTWLFVVAAAFQILTMVLARLMLSAPSGQGEAGSSGRSEAGPPPAS